MAVVGIFTNSGILKCRQSQFDEGFKIYPTGFGVSDIAGDIDPNRTSSNSGEWYTGEVSSRYIVDDNTVKIICTVPPRVLPIGQTREIREIYLYAQDPNNVEFLLALGQPTNNIIYDTDGSTTLEMEISLTNADLSSMFVFKYTEAHELAEHNFDPNGHPEIIDALNRDGQFLRAGGIEFRYAGQSFDDHYTDPNGVRHWGVEFDGSKASGVRGGITFTAIHRGSDGNTITLTFDGVKTTDEVILEWNNNNKYLGVTHNGNGSEVLPLGLLTLTGGTTLVEENDIVYKDTDGLYKKAVADGTLKSKAIGIIFVSRRLVKTSGFIDLELGYSLGTDLFLSSTNPGKLTNQETSVKLATVVDSKCILFNAFTPVSPILSQGVDAIVDDTIGFKHYPTTQLAVNAVSSGSRVLINKYEALSYSIQTLNKQIDFLFNGNRTGWYKSLGIHETQHVGFSSVPASGTWRLEWNGQETIDLPYNATNAQVQTAFNMLIGHAGVTVSGNYIDGFTLVYNGYEGYPEPTLNHLGQSEIQQIEYSDIPDDGTIRFDFEGQETANIAWNDTNLQYEGYLEELNNITDVSITGGFNSLYHRVEWVGLDAIQPKGNLIITQNILKKNGLPVTVVMNNLQEGKYPANNLKTAGGTSLIVNITQINAGSPIGSDYAIDVSADNTTFHGLGKIYGFKKGIVLNGFKGSKIEMNLDPTLETPIDAEGLVAGVDYITTGSIGTQFQDLADGLLKLIEHPTNKKRVIVSAGEYNLFNGGSIGQELNKAILKFDGAEIDFELGKVFANDGVTEIGLTFPTPTIANTKYRWFSVSLLPKQFASDNRITAQLFILPAASDGNTPEVAPRASFVSSGKKLGQIAVQGSDSSISDIFQTQIFQLGTGSGSGDGEGDTQPYILAAHSSSLEFKAGTFTWTNPMNIIHPYFYEASIASGVMNFVAEGDILYTKVFPLSNFIADGTAGGQVQVIDPTIFNIGDTVVIGDLDSNKSSGVIVSTNPLLVDNGLGNFLDLTSYTVSNGAWIVKTNLELYKGKVNEGELKPDALGNIDSKIFIIGNCLGNSIFLVNGREVTWQWVYDESVFVEADIQPEDVLVLPLDSRNGNIIRRYKNGIAELEVYVNGALLGRDAKILVDTFSAISYDNISGIILVPDSVDLSFVQRNCVLHDVSGNSFRILGQVVNVSSYKQFQISPSQTPNLSSCYITTQDYQETGVLHQYSNTIISKINIPKGTILRFKLEPVASSSGASSNNYTASNVGTGIGVFKQKLNNNFEFRNIKAGEGISISLIGDDIVITNTGGGTPTSTYFVNYINNNTGVSINSLNNYELGVGKLSVYRNGVKLVNSLTVGSGVDRYQEVNPNTITLGQAVIENDLITFIHDDIAPTINTIITGVTGNTINIPTYNIGTQRLKVFRNGVLMNSVGVGSIIDQYSETTNTSITLVFPASIDDIFTIEELGYTPDFREEISGITGTTLNLINNYTMGNKRLLVYRNGVLMNNSGLVGEPVNQYSEVSTNSILLGLQAIPTDVFTFINKP